MKLFTHSTADPQSSELGSLYREIFERCIDGIAIIDSDGFYIQQNAAHEELTGFNDADLRGRTPAIHLGEEGFRRIAEALDRDHWFRGTLESVGKSGERKQIDLAAFPVRDGKGRPQYYVGIKRDVSELQRVSTERDARLRELECLYSLTRSLNQAFRLEDIFLAAVESLVVAVRADRASVLVYGNDGLMHFRAWQGLSEEYRAAVDGHSPWRREQRGVSSILVSDVFQDRSLQSYVSVFAKEGIRGLAFIPICFEGQLLGKFMLYYNEPHAFSDAEIRMAEAVAAQIAIAINRKNAEEVLRKSEKLAAAGKLSAAVAHEINNPLEGIVNLAYLLRERIQSSGDEIAAEYLSNLENELRRVALITRKTLAFYRDTERSTKVEIATLVSDLVDLFRPNLEAHAVELRAKVAEGACVFGSAGEIRQVLLNLLTNATDAIGSGGTIELNVGRSGNEIAISIADTGPGINPADLPMIFEPFYTTKTTGTGLGLALSREIVVRHGGRISAENRAGGGAVIHIHLPVNCSSSEREERLRPNAAKAS